MDRNKRPCTDRLCMILRISLAYAASNQKKHTKYQLIELYKACHEMASSASRYKMVAKIACLKIGLLYYDIARFHEALNYHEKHLRICRETGNLAEEERAYCSIGCVYHSLGQYQKAMEYHEKYLRICKQTGDLSGEGTSYGNIGAVCISLGQYQKAMEYHEKHLRICKQTGDLSGEGTSYGNIGVVRRSLGQYQKAIEYHEKHLCINRETGNLAGEGRAYGNIGGVYRCLGQYQKAMEYCEKYWLTCQETGDLAEEGRAYCSIGCVYHSLGQYQKAMEYHEKHLCICQETGHLTGEGTSYGNIGVVYKSLGQYQKAMEYNEKHLRMCQETGHLTGEGRAYRNIGGVYHELGQYQKAMGYYEEHLRICQGTGDLAGEGRSYCSIGGVYYDLGQYQKAMEYNEKYLRICQKTGDLSGKGGSCCNIGLVYHSLGQYEKAMEYFKNQLRICHETGDLTAEGQIYYNIGLARFKNDDIHEAEISLKESIRCFEEIFKFLHQQDNYKVSIVDTYIKAYRFLTKVLIASGKVKEALLISERGRAQALRDKLVMKYGEEGTSELPNGDIDSLVSSSESSFLFLSIQDHEVLLFVIEQGKELHLRRTLSRPCSGEKSREELMSHINKMLLDVNEHSKPKDRSMEQDKETYPLQDLALEDLLSADDVENVTTTKEDVLKDNATSCLSSYGRESTVQSEKRRAISEPQRKKTQVNQPVTGTGTLESEQDVQSEVALPGSTIEQDGAFRQNSTADKQSNEDQNDAANVFEDLYQVLIAPVEEALTKPEIIIIPDGPFFFVPFAALKGKSGTFLSETKRIRIGPSLTTLKLLKECPAEKHCKKGALIVGGPEAGEVMYRGKKKTFDDLPNAMLEARIIGRILGAKPLTGSSARKDRVKRRLQEGVSIIHIATHGNKTTGELVLAPEPCDDEDDEEIPKEEDYMLTVEEIHSSRINAQLVVLSCCHSGRGEIKAEGVVGLTRAFLAAGARSVLASLWAIDDLAACFFMEAFYRHLKSGESASESLQQAMKEMRKKPAFSHPRFWASFFIVGDDIRINT